MSPVAQSVSEEDKRRFSEQIAEAVKQLGPEAAAGCMARSLIYLAHTVGGDIEFTTDLGQVCIERRLVPDAEKH